MSSVLTMMVMSEAMTLCLRIVPRLSRWHVKDETPIYLKSLSPRSPLDQPYGLCIDLALLGKRLLCSLSDRACRVQQPLVLFLAIAYCRRIIISCSRDIGAASGPALGCLFASTSDLNTTIICLHGNLNVPLQHAEAAGGSVMADGGADHLGKHIPVMVQGTHLGTSNSTFISDPLRRCSSGGGGNQIRRINCEEIFE